MKRLPVLLFLGAVVVIAACAASVAIAFRADSTKSTETSHDWVHTKLAITGEQEGKLAPIERRFRDQKQRIERELRRANTALADAILADGGQSEDVARAIETIHSHMGALQRLTVAHVFEMRGVLSDEQYQTLLNLTASALRNLDEPVEDGAHH